MADRFYIRLQHNLDKLYARYGLPMTEVRLVAYTSELGEYYFKAVVTSATSQDVLKEMELEERIEIKNQVYAIVLEAYTLTDSTYTHFEKNIWILMDMSKLVRYKSVTFPIQWVLDIVPLILTSHQFIFDDFVALTLPIELVPLIRQRVEKEYIRLLDSLLELYRRGSIVMKDKRSKLLIKNWQLSESEVHKGVYQPDWKNTLLTGPDITNYLLGVNEKKTYLETLTELHDRGYSRD